MAGRPSLYSEVIADEILDQLVEGKSLVEICSAPAMPHRITVIRWMRRDPEFATKCAHARAEQADLMENRVMTVADKVESGELEPDAGKVVISACQWRASKLNPRVYGDKTTVAHTGPSGGPVHVVAIPWESVPTEKLELVQQALKLAMDTGEGGE